LLRTQQVVGAAWRAGCDTDTSGEDNLKTFALVEAAYEAAATRRSISPRSL
jgi:D-apiose dehydrogenase